MDLLVIQSPKGSVGLAQEDCCVMHPDTMFDLRVPTLGMVSVQDALLFNGAKVFLRSFTCESIPLGGICLASWLTDSSSGQQPLRVRVDGIHADEPLDVIKKISVVPLPHNEGGNGISHWIRPTDATNANLVRHKRKDRGWTERLLKQRIEGQLARSHASIGSVFSAMIKSQTHRFRVIDVQFGTTMGCRMGVIGQETMLEIGQEPVSKQEVAAITCAGMETLSQEICKFIVDSFRRANAYTHLGIPNKKAAIVTGVAGSGKKTLVQTLGLRIFPLALARALSDRDIMESDQAAGLSHIRTVFDIALQSAPSAVILQDLDTIAKDRGVDSLLQSSTVSILCKEIERARRSTDVFVIAISRNRRMLPDIFLKQDIFQHEFQIPIPVKAQRQDMMEALMASMSGTDVEENMAQKPMASRAAQSLVRPRRSNYGGYTGLRKRVNQAIHWPITNPETFKRMGVKPPMGLLLYGPSGCGKTMLVQTLAAESSMNFIPIKGPEIFSKYLGETEATLRRLFAMAHQIAPCILFFDEMDSIGAKRGWGGDGDSQGSNGVNERVLSTLLNEMDGVEERTGVFVIGCTNQPRAMDDALMRPGRLDQLIYVGYPTLQDRADIINTIGERIPLPKDLETRSKLAKLTVGFSPADLDALFREAAILSLRRDIATRHVDLCDVDEVARTMSPSVQDRIDKSALRNPDGWDVVVPDLYRQFQQGLRE
ncbi:hypothetical protein BGZ58_008380 [Dissophora ornata]|nr:hypothetical protein BGZ58_008380 [Dissophora ornata]